MPEKFCLMESSVGVISIALVTRVWPGCSHLKIEILLCASTRTVANRLKYSEMSFVLSYCIFVGNSTVSLISQVDSRSPVLTKKASDARTLISCRTGAFGGRSIYGRSVENYLNVGGVKIG